MAGEPGLVRPTGTARRRRPFRPLGLSRDNGWLALSTFFYGAAIGFYQYVLPLDLSRLGASPDQVGLGLAIGNSGGIVGLLVGGLLVNRHSLRLQIITSWLLTCVSGALFVVAGSWQIVALALLLSTLTLFGIPAYTAYIVLARDGQESVEALTIVYAGFTAGMSITPALGGWIIATMGMTAMFVASLVCVVASTIVVVPLRDYQSIRDGTPAETISARGVGRLVALLLPYRDALADRGVRGLLVVTLGIYLSTFTGISLLPNYLQDRLGLEAATISVLGSGAALVGVIGALTIARLVGRYGSYRALALAELMLVVGFALALAAPTLGGLGLVAGGVGFAMRGGTQAQQSLARAMIANVAVGRRMGPSFALQSIVFNVAYTVGPALAGVLYTQDPSLPLALGLVSGLPLVLWLASRPRRRMGAAVPGEGS